MNQVMISALPESGPTPWIILTSPGSLMSGPALVKTSRFQEVGMPFYFLLDAQEATMELTVTGHLLTILHLFVRVLFELYHSPIYLLVKTHYYMSPQW